MLAIFQSFLEATRDQGRYTGAVSGIAGRLEEQDSCFQEMS